MSIRNDMKLFLREWSEYIKKPILKEADFEAQRDRTSFSSGKEDMLTHYSEEEKRKLEDLVNRYFDFSSITGSPDELANTKKELIEHLLKNVTQGITINPEHILIGIPETAGITDKGEFIPAALGPTSGEREKARGSSKKRGAAFQIYEKTINNSPEYVIYDNDQTGLNQFVNGLKNAEKLIKKPGTEGTYSTTTYLVGSDGDSKEIDPLAKFAPRKWDSFRLKVLSKLLLKHAKSSEEGKRPTVTGAKAKEVIEKMRGAIQEYPLIVAGLYDAIENPTSENVYKRAMGIFTSPDPKVSEKSDYELIDAAIKEKYGDIPWTRQKINSELDPKIKFVDPEYVTEFIKNVKIEEKQLDAVESKFLGVAPTSTTSSKVFVFDFDGTIIDTLSFLGAKGIENSWKFLPYLNALKPEYKQKVFSLMAKKAIELNKTADVMREQDARPENTYIVSNIQLANLRNEQGIQRPVTKYDFMTWFAENDPDLMSFLSRFLGNTSAATSIKKIAAAHAPKTEMPEDLKFKRTDFQYETADQNKVIGQFNWYARNTDLTPVQQKSKEAFEKWLTGYENYLAANGLKNPLRQDDTAHDDEEEEDFDQGDYDHLDEIKATKKKTLKEQLSGLRFRLGTKK